MRRKSPITIQQWVDSLPIPPAQQNNKPLSSDTTMSTTEKDSDDTISKNNSTTSNTTNNQTGSSSSANINIRGILSRDASFQSDDACSHCSSVESVLEFRRPDPEEVLIGLGFGPSYEEDETARIPKRFLHPSKLAGINVEPFLQKENKDNPTTYYWPANMTSSLNIGREFKDIPYRKDSNTFG
ncbi:protein ITPRID1 [Chrysoperla carnea]|uniref:protein ITPRID1 n=1 Tax=Chrysoperla carnea TaxID=189513 RepID=UPI001D064D40|nr:protein ITPRID1 [Chrysoperla carnea]